MKILKNTKKLITALLVSVAIFLSGQIFLSAFSLRAAKAETSIDITTSSVRDDLESMDMDKLSYLSDTKNIFITMSQYYDTNNQLRSYIYINFFDRTSDYKLYVNLSVAVSDSNYNITEEYKDYELTFINNEETWCKYEIIGLPNLFEVTRRYNIKSVGYYVSSTNKSIYVPIISNIEQTFIYNGITNNSIQVFHQEVETITITDKVVATYCFGDGLGGFIFPETTYMHPGDIYTDSWFVFFNTDKKIDELLEIELTYTAYEFYLDRMLDTDADMTKAFTLSFLEESYKNDTYVWTNFSYDFEKGLSWIKPKEPVVTTIYPGTTKVSYTDKKWFGKYNIVYEEFDNIMYLPDYKSNVGSDFVFTNYAEKYSWGVHFLDTERSFSHFDSEYPWAYAFKGRGVSDFAILRLKFMTDGIGKNCYAVDTPTSDFEGNAAETDKNEDRFKKIIAFIAVVLICVIIGPFISPVLTVVFQFLGKILGFLIRFIWKMLTFPFKLFKRSGTKKRKR